MAIVDDPRALTLSVTEFKARCLEIFARLQAGELDRVTVTRRGAVVAQVGPPNPEPRLPDLWGALRGRSGPIGDVDLTQPIFEGEIEAELGRWDR